LHTNMISIQIKLNAGSEIGSTIAMIVLSVSMWYLYLLPYKIIFTFYLVM